MLKKLKREENVVKITINYKFNYLIAKLIFIINYFDEIKFNIKY